jgi:hypothetical protein
MFDLSREGTMALVLAIASNARRTRVRITLRDHRRLIESVTALRTSAWRPLVGGTFEIDGRTAN